MSQQQHEDPAAEAGGKVTQALALAATGAEALAQVHARRAQQRADEQDRQTRALRVQARAEQAAAMLGKSGEVSGGRSVPERDRPTRFDATGEPMPSASAVVVVEGEVAGRGYATGQGQQTAGQARQAASAAATEQAEQAVRGAQTVAAARSGGVRS